MSDERTRREITNILGELDLSFSVSKDSRGESRWTVNFSSDNSQVIQINLAVAGSWLIVVYNHGSVPPADPNILSQLLKLNARTNLARVGLTANNRPLAWTTIHLLTKDEILEALGQVARAAEAIKGTLPN